MLSPSERVSPEAEPVNEDARFGFTWVPVDDKCLLRTPDDRFKEVPEVVVDTLRERSADTDIDELIAETAEMDAGAADVIRGMRADGFIREDAPVRRVRPPDDVRLWPRAVGVGLLVLLAGTLAAATLSGVAGPFLENPFGFLLGTAHVSTPLILGAVLVHEYGHYHAAAKQGLDPSLGTTVANGVVPAVVTRTHGGWALPRNRRMWNALAGPAFGLAWTLGVFGLYYAIWPHPGVAVAGMASFNVQFVALLPLFHGDGYLLLTDLLGEQNLRTRGKADVRDLRPTWPATYAVLSYGLVIATYSLNLVVGYLLAGLAGAVVVLCLAVGLYAGARTGAIERFLSTFSPFRA